MGSLNWLGSTFKERSHIDVDHVQPEPNNSPIFNRVNISTHGEHLISCNLVYKLC